MRAAQTTAPTIALPKGGGAIRSIGEKFGSNPATGAGSMVVPIAVSKGRSGFSPELALSYDSGSGNSPFGFGWQLGLPSITRKTEKGLPRYADALGSDVFMLSGAEDLVPYEPRPIERGPDPMMESYPEARDQTIDGYAVRRYRPRIDSAFARIERWTRIDDAKNVHWRILSRDNILTLYGVDADARIADPADTTRIYAWLISETRDDKGNAVLYCYKREDGALVDVKRSSEHNRGSAIAKERTANRYVKRILYGNRKPLLNNGKRPFIVDRQGLDAQVANGEWMFEVVFDYGEHDLNRPLPSGTGVWAFRHDAFTTYRPGFELRTSRLCRRILMFHHFPDRSELGHGYLVRSTDLTFAEAAKPGGSGGL